MDAAAVLNHDEAAHLDVAAAAAPEAGKRQRRVKFHAVIKNGDQSEVVEFDRKRDLHKLLAAGQTEVVALFRGTKVSYTEAKTFVIA